jgi:hypothetical protein
VVDAARLRLDFRFTQTSMTVPVMEGIHEVTGVIHAENHRSDGNGRDGSRDRVHRPDPGVSRDGGGS